MFLHLVAVVSPQSMFRPVSPQGLRLPGLSYPQDKEGAFLSPFHRVAMTVEGAVALHLEV